MGCGVWRLGFRIGAIRPLGVGISGFVGAIEVICSACTCLKQNTSVKCTAWVCTARNGAVCGVPEGKHGVKLLSTSANHLSLASRLRS